jgi:hypothetical protein
MAKLSLSLDQRSEQNGMQSVRMRITQKGTSAWVHTGVKVEPQYFQSGSLYDPIHRKAYMAVEKREQLTRIVRQVEEYLADVEPSALERMTANEIREAALGISVGRAGGNSLGISVGRSECKHGGSAEVYGSGMSAAATRRSVKKDAIGGVDFLQVFDEYAASRTVDKTRKSYEYAWNVLREYCKARSLMRLPITTIDYARLTDYARWLKASGRGPSTCYMMENYVRAVYKDAQKRRLVGRELDPYYDYSIKKVPAKDIDCLNAADMHRLMAIDLSACPGLDRARNIAVASFCLCGVNLLDMYLMGHAVDGNAEFVRHKVERSSQMKIKIRIEPELQVILTQIGGSERLFCFAEKHPTFGTFQRRQTLLLHQVGEKIGIDVTMAKIRRTWATIAGELECPENVINHSMGHVVGTVNARFYEKYDWSLTAKWNRKIIDYILHL